jgi:hypothetical protein
MSGIPNCCSSCATGGPCDGGPKSPLVAEDRPVALPAVSPNGVRLAERLGVMASRTAASEPVRIEGSNAVRVDVVVWASTLDAIQVRVLGSNDAENYTPLAEFRRTEIGYTTIRVPGIGFRFVRVTYEGTGGVGSGGVLAASLRHWRN